MKITSNLYQSALNSIKTSQKNIETSAKKIASGVNLTSEEALIDPEINTEDLALSNTEAAESKITDVDMAREYLNITKQAMLHKSGTALLSQANSNATDVANLLDF
ncbi:MAG: hypothetical protein J6M02_00985 [Clostridia bacterium]|nr:hypothetical protein [Clostridia bacterium]